MHLSFIDASDCPLARFFKPAADTFTTRNLNFEVLIALSLFED
jgi:hypothetical protein